MIAGTILQPVGKAAWHVLWDDGHVDKNATHPSSVLKFLRSGHEESESNDYPLSLLDNVAEQHDSSSDKENGINEENGINKDSDRSEDYIKTAFCNEFTQRIKEYNKDIAKAKEDVHDLIGTKFKPKTGDLKPLWTVVSNVDSVRTPLVDQRTIFSSLSKKQFDAFSLFWELWHSDIYSQHRKMNKIAEQQMQLKHSFGSLTSRWKPVSKQEFQT